MSLSLNSTEFALPDSELARKATQLVMEVSPQFLYHHCVRTFLFAELTGLRHTMKYDRELLYLGALMHDLGLTERFYGNQRFEVDGADAARSFLLTNGLPEEKAEAVWDAIALHTSIGIASRKSPEIALVHLGATIDVGGLGLEDLDPETVERVIEVYPRVGCGQALLSLIVSQVKRKPQTAAFTWMAEVGRCHLNDFACLTFDQVILNNPLDKLH